MLTADCRTSNRRHAIAAPRISNTNANASGNFTAIDCRDQNGTWAFRAMLWWSPIVSAFRTLTAARE